MMGKKRFFSTLHFARELSATQADKVLRYLLIKTFFYAYSMGWQGKEDKAV